MSINQNTVILDGKVIALKEKERIVRDLRNLNYKIGLAVVLVGDDPASMIYVASKERTCKEVGIQSKVIRLPKETRQEELLELIGKLNSDDTVHGILIQSPVPDHINENLVIDAIDPKKDVDCFHPYNFGRLLSGNPVVEPCTPKGVIKIFEHYNIEIAGKNTVILGRSNIVGKPIAIMMMQRNATITICHSKTKDLKNITKQADIIITAIGKPEFLKADMVSDGVVIADVGINRVEDKSCEKGYRVVGDADYKSLFNKASAITPVPGGVGAMTIIMLLDNTIQLAKLSGNC